MKRGLVLVGLLIALSLSSAQAQLVIGINLSTTGPAASLGIPEKNVFTSLAPPVIAGQKVRYVVYDDASDPTTAVQNVKRLMTQDHVDVLLGMSVSPTSRAVTDAVAEGKTPTIVFGSSIAIVSPMDEKRRWMFKTAPHDQLFTAAALNHMVKTGVKTLSIISIDDALGESSVAGALVMAPERGIKIVSVDKFQREDTSATAQAVRAMQNNPDAVFIIASGTVAATPHRALIQRGYKGRIYQSGGAVNADFLRVGGKDVEGAYASTPPLIVTEQLPASYPTREPALEFLRVYEAKYGSGSRSQYAGHAWDAIKLLEASIPVALRQAKPGTVQFREALRTSLENCRGIKGVQAIYNMSSEDHTGIDQWGMVLVKITNGSWKLEDYQKP